MATLKPDKNRTEELVERLNRHPKFRGDYIDSDTNMKMAGALQQGKLSNFNAAKIFCSVRHTARRPIMVRSSIRADKSRVVFTEARANDECVTPDMSSQH
jgi:hypothetical protein